MCGTIPLPSPFYANPVSLCMLASHSLTDLVHNSECVGCIHHLAGGGLEHALREREKIMEKLVWCWMRATWGCMCKLTVYTTAQYTRLFIHMRPGSKHSPGDMRSVHSTHAPPKVVLAMCQCTHQHSLSSENVGNFNQILAQTSKYKKQKRTTPYKLLPLRKRLHVSDQN